MDRQVPAKNDILLASFGPEHRPKFCGTPTLVLVDCSHWNPTNFKIAIHWALFGVCSDILIGLV
jgi:hypothetical protein